ncbi:MAG: hypothetical protein WC227_02130 [Patescibacteria group bacterium]
MTIPAPVQDILAILNQSGSSFPFEYGKPAYIHLEFRVVIRKRANKVRTSIQFLWPTDSWTKRWPSEAWSETHIARYVFGICKQHIAPTIANNGSASICFKLSVYSKTIYVGQRRSHSNDNFGKKGSTSL